MVAWFIAAFSWLGHSALAVRFPFILAEALAALFLGAAAVELSGNVRAGAAATILFTFVPQLRFMIGEALPDGPYLLFWAMALWLPTRIMKRQSMTDIVLLGLALGGAVLSRAFGWWVVLGILLYFLSTDRTILRRRVWISFLIAAVLYAPFVTWNAAHDWVNLSFTLRERLRPHDLFRADYSTFASIRTVLLVAIFWLVCYYTAIRRGYSLVAWTALPFATFLAALSVFKVVESYWLLGPFASACVGIGAAYADAAFVWKRVLGIVWGAAAAYTVATAIFPVLPESAQAKLLDDSHGALRGPAYSEVFGYAPLSRDVLSISNGHVTALTDRYEIASELLWNGVDSRTIVSRQEWQWRLWYGTKLPPRALVVTYYPLNQDPLLLRRLRRTYASIVSAGMLRSSFAHVASHHFYLAWVQ